MALSSSRRLPVDSDLYLLVSYAQIERGLRQHTRVTCLHISDGSSKELLVRSCSEYRLLHISCDSDVCKQHALHRSIWRVHSCQPLHTAKTIPLALSASSAASRASRRATFSSDKSITQLVLYSQSPEIRISRQDVLPPSHVLIGIVLCRRGTLLLTCLPTSDRSQSLHVVTGTTHSIDNVVCCCKNQYIPRQMNSACASNLQSLCTAQHQHMVLTRQMYNTLKSI